MQRDVSTRRASWHLAALVAMAIATTAGPLAAQQTGRIRGRITDADDKSALPAAQVQVVGTTLGAATGATGQYVIAGVPAEP